MPSRAPLQRPDEAKRFIEHAEQGTPPKLELKARASRVGTAQFSSPLTRKNIAADAEEAGQQHRRHE